MGMEVGMAYFKVPSAICMEKMRKIMHAFRQNRWYCSDIGVFKLVGGVPTTTDDRELT
jgi:hypothetical protein